MDRLLPPAPQPPLPRTAGARRPAKAVDRVFMHALGRAPSPAERRIAMRAMADPAQRRPCHRRWTRRLLWALMMKPEFQLIY